MKHHPLQSLAAILLVLVTLVGALQPTVALAQPRLNENDASGIISDDFNRCGLDTSLWTVVDPQSKLTSGISGVGTDDAVLEMSIPGGDTLNITAKKTDAPRIMQPTADTDFTIETKFDSGMDTKYQVQGILIQGDNDNFIRFDFHSNGAETRMYAAIIDVFDPPTTTMKAKVDVAIDVNGVSPLWMRVQRDGNTWTPTFSTDGETFNPPPNDEPSSFNHDLTVTDVGVFVGTSSQKPDLPPAHTAKVDYFFNTASPIEPEDGPTFEMNINPEGAGTAVTDPATLGDAQCNTSITLSATANPGFAFANWSDDLTSTDNPATLTFVGRQQVTANFDPVQYTVSATSSNEANGTVTKNPEQAQYDYGDTVELTANAVEGWHFVEWSGDVPEGLKSSNPVTITVDSDKTILGNFAEDLPDQYQLTLPTPENGTVAANPAPPGFFYDAGTEVVLTATPDEGWLFDSWSGNVPSGKEQDNPLTITMDDNKSLTAVFVEQPPETYTLDVSIGTGMGTVTKSPDKTVYTEGEQVKLTATPADGWLFDGWSGDITESDNLVTITMDANKVITAAFIEDESRIYLPLIVVGQ